MPGFVGNRLQNALNREGQLPRRAGRGHPGRPRQGGHHLLGIRYATIGPFLSGQPGRGPRRLPPPADHIGKEMDKMQLGEVTQDPKVRERLIEAVEKTLRVFLIHPTLRGTRPQQLAVLTALASVNHKKEQWI